jgi:tetratricopeptide (TPR) repeat protein
MKWIVYLIIISAVGIVGCSQSGNQSVKYFESGNSEMKAGNLINAIVYYNKAIALDTTRVDYFWARGNARLTTVDYEGATKDFTKVIQMDPGRAEAYLLRAQIKIYKKEFSDDAVNDLNKAILLNPNLARAYYNLGVIRYVRNDPNMACEYWKKAAEMGYRQAQDYIKMHCKQN